MKSQLIINSHHKLSLTPVNSPWITMKSHWITINLPEKNHHWSSSITIDRHHSTPLKYHSSAHQSAGFLALPRLRSRSPTSQWASTEPRPSRRRRDIMACVRAMVQGIYPTNMAKHMVLTVPPFFRILEFHWYHGTVSGLFHWWENHGIVMANHGTEEEWYSDINW